MSVLEHKPHKIPKIEIKRELEKVAQYTGLKNLTAF
jgi:hypothetical protein